MHKRISTHSFLCLRGSWFGSDSSFLRNKKSFSTIKIKRISCKSPGNLLGSCTLCKCFALVKISSVDRSKGARVRARTFQSKCFFGSSVLQRATVPAELCTASASPLRSFCSGPSLSVDTSATGCRFQSSAPSWGGGSAPRWTASPGRTSDIRSWWGKHETVASFNK